MTIQKTGRVYPVFSKYERNTIVRITAHRKIEITPKSLLFFFPLITNPPCLLWSCVSHFLSAGWTKCPEVGRGDHAPQLWDTLSQRGAARNTDFILPLAAGNGKSLTDPYPCPGVWSASAPAGGGRCPQRISPDTASSSPPGWACTWRSSSGTGIGSVAIISSVRRENLQRKELIGH